MTQAGFWRDTRVENRRATLNGYQQINNVWCLFPQGGAPPNGFATSGIFNTFAKLKPHLRNRDLIYLSGVLREQVVAPDDVFDVMVLGAANQPRQATSAGVATGGGATWMAPLSPTATTPLIEVVRAGWTFQNIAFNPVASSAAVRLTRSAVTDLIDASHAQFINCYFIGGGSGQIGIEDNGGAGFVLVEGCRFQLLTGTAILGLNTAAAIPLSWQIVRNNFISNTNDIKMSLSQSLIEMNRFFAAGSGSSNKVISTVAVSGQGNNNHVLLNQFKNIVTEIKNNNGYNGGSTDTWNNYAEGTAALIVESPPGAS